VDAPSKTVRLKLTPDTAEHPEARLFVRGFGAHQVAVAALSLAGRRWRGLERPAAAVALAIDASDMISAAIEARDRGRLDADLSGGMVFSAAGVATAAPTALWPPARH
jgi:predicted alpha-1,6-mannanase (GH76 family)